MKAAEPGDVVGGAYVVERELGRGGMGVVLAARDRRSGRPVALKLLAEGTAGGGEGRARFVREATLAARVRSEHVVEVLDAGTTEAGAPFLVMELLEGQDLGALAKRAGVLPVAEAVAYVRDAALGLAAAHAEGVLHRDLKPGNVFVCRRPDGSQLVKLVDFGLAKQAVGERTLTRSGVALGSPKYMAPEQYRSARDVDARADIYGLGAILYRLLTGRPPHDGDSLESVLVSILSEPVAPIRSLRADVPPALDDLVLRCLDPAPERRPARADELARSLGAFALGVGGGAPASPPLGLPSSPYPAAATLTAAIAPTFAPAPTQAPPGRARWAAPGIALVFGGLVALGTLGAGTALVLRGALGGLGVGPAPATPERFDPAERVDAVRRRAAAKWAAPKLLKVVVSAPTQDGLVTTDTSDRSVLYLFATASPECRALVVGFGAGKTWETCAAEAPVDAPVPDPRCSAQAAMRAVAKKLGGSPVARQMTYFKPPRAPVWIVDVEPRNWLVDGATCAVSPL